MLPVIFLVNLQTHGFVQVPQARGRQRSLINALAMFIMTYYAAKRHRQIFLFRPLGTKPPNLMTANISGYTVCWSCFLAGLYSTLNILLRLGCWKTRNAQEQNRTEPEVIDAQYGRRRWTRGQKLVLIRDSDLTFCNSYKDRTSTSREPHKACELLR